LTTVPHPTYLDDEELVSRCDVLRQRRSGPGGQHRNKVETAIVLRWPCQDISVEATERRSQNANLEQAVWRLRLKLAVQQRGTLAETAPSELWQRRSKNRRVSVGPQHADFPKLLAEALDVLAASDWSLQHAAENLQISATQLLKLLKIHPPAALQLNKEREIRGLRPLK
jgi:protein subunit release factor B